MSKEAGSEHWPHPGAEPGPFSSAEQKAMDQLQLNKDELRVLRECNQESFWYRCVPLSIAGVTATQLAVNKGLLSAHPKYGSAFKLMFAGLSGFVIGKISYTRACKEKLMRLDNSPLAESIRGQKYGRGPASRWGQDRSDSDSAQLEMPSLNVDQRQPSNEDYNNSDFSSDYNQQRQGLDDTFRPNLDSIPSTSSSQFPSRSDAIQPQPLEEKTSPELSYADLRRQNRQDYNNRRASSNQSSPGSSPSGGSYRDPRDPAARTPRPGGPYYRDPPSRTSPPAPAPPTYGRGRHEQDQPKLGAYSPKPDRNKYGDSWEEH